MHSFKWGEVTYIWTQKWGEGRLNGMMNGGRIVGKAEKWGSILRRRKKRKKKKKEKNGGSILELRKKWGEYT